MVCEKEKLGKLLLNGLLVAQNYRLVVEDYVYVVLELVHVLIDRDLTFLGLILICIKPCG